MDPRYFQDKNRSRRKKGAKTPAPTYLTNLGLSKINASVPKISPYRAVRLHITETKDFFAHQDKPTNYILAH